MRDGQRIIDSDIHVLEPPDLFERYLDPAFRERAPRRPRAGPGVWEIEGRVIPAYLDRPDRQRSWAIRMQRAARQAERRPDARERGGTRPEAMLRAMDTEGLDIAVVFRTWAGHVTCIDGLEPAFAAALCRAFNRWLCDFCSADRERLKLGALIPLHDVDRAREEARFAVRELGAVTLVLPSQPVNGRPLYDPAYDALWAEAQELDVAVSFHGIHAAYNEHLARRYLDNLVLAHAVGQPVELMLCLGSVLTGGVLARFPGLRAAFLEGNCAWVPWWLWALDERWEKWADHERFGQKERPSELFARHCYVSVEPDEALARHVVSDLGDANLVLSTDWPHDDSAYPHAIDHFLQLDLPTGARGKILWDNCARLYGLD